MKRGSSALWRRLEDAVSGTLAARERERLFDDVRADPQAQAHYDLAFEALRELEQAPVAQAELDVVEAWLMDDARAEAVQAVPWWRRRSGWFAGVFAVAAAAALLMTLRPSPPEPDDGFQARGAGDEHGLAIDALCPQRSGNNARHGLVPAAEYGCGLHDTLSFAYRVEPGLTPDVLTLFGLTATGDVLYYAPTPADEAGLAVHPGTWTPLPMVVQLDVNHDPGAVVVYGLLSSHAPTVAQIDAMAAALAAQPAVGLSAPQWHERIADDVHALCPTSSDCESAELSFSIHEAPR